MLTDRKNKLFINAMIQWLDLDTMRLICNQYKLKCLNTVLIRLNYLSLGWRVWKWRLRRGSKAIVLLVSLYPPPTEVIISSRYWWVHLWRRAAPHSHLPKGKLVWQNAISHWGLTLHPNAIIVFLECKMVVAFKRNSSTRGFKMSRKKVKWGSGK